MRALTQGRDRSIAFCCHSCRSADAQGRQLGLQVAGVRLAAGNYSVMPAPAAAFHLYVLCNLNRTAPFTIDLGNSTLVLTVRAECPAAIQEAFSGLHAGPMRGWVWRKRY